MDQIHNERYLIKKNEIKCIFCRRNSDYGEEYRMSNEHVIPQVLGGWLTIPFLCVSCNSMFGALYESNLKKNGFVVAAIDKLRLQPKAQAYKEAELTLTLDGDKSLAAYFDKSDVPKHFPQQIEDGSLIIPEEQAKDVLRKQIERYERDSGIKVQFDIESYNSLPYGIVIPIYPSPFSFIKHRNRKKFLTISGLDQPIPFIVPAKIAFEHLAGLYYPYVLRNEFNPIRDWLHHGDANVNNHVLLNSILRDKAPGDLEYQPFHFVRLGYQNESLSAIVCLFGVMYFSVYLARLLDFSDFPFPDIIGTYHIYDVQDRLLYPENAPQSIQDEDDKLLQLVSHFGCVHTMNG